MAMFNLGLLKTRVFNFIHGIYFMGINVIAFQIDFQEENDIFEVFRIYFKERSPFLVEFNFLFS